MSVGNIAGAGRRRVRIGIDVGGTFTDVVAIDDDGGALTVLKVPSTPSQPNVAVLTGLEHILLEIGEVEVGFLGHGTTAGTNAFLTKRGARTVLLTTQGFEDVLEFRRMDRTGVLDPYDIQLDFPKPLVPARRRVGVAERVGRDGSVVSPLLDAEVARVLEEIEASEADSVAISLLWSFENPDHEIRLRDAVRNAFPDLFVTCSHEIDPSLLEYERTSTTVVNAYLGPLINRYFTQVESGVEAIGLPPPRIMQSNGGLSSIREAARRPVSLLESGPAAGVAACAYLGETIGVENLLAVDMGGTSFDVALVVDGVPRRNVETEVDGYVVRVPMLDIRSIGAGGGSIAWIDEGGGLRVGPQSAGSEPGPVCYGRGGQDPTVSDANAVLGYLQSLTGGSLTLDIESARRRLIEVVGTPLGVDAIGAAEGIYRLVNAHMADAMRLIMSEGAISPGDITLMAYGGAGPVHAAALARELEIVTTVIPDHPGALSALGVAIGDLVHDLVKPVMLPLDVLPVAQMVHEFDDMIEEGRRILRLEGCSSEQMSFEAYFVARYIGQMHDLQVLLPGGSLDDFSLQKFAGQFHERHRDAYGVAVEDEPVFVVSARLRAIGRITKPVFDRYERTCEPEPERTVDAWFAGYGQMEVPLYLRAAWRPDRKLPGPAIIQEYDSTTVVLPEQSWHVHEIGLIVIEEM